MIPVPGGTFTMGSDRHYPEERPAHEVHVDAFAISPAPVTVAEFAAFVEATGHVTAAERVPDGFDVPAGSAVFMPPDHPVDLTDPSGWWSWVAGACWRHPTGPGSAAVDDHPVVQVAYDDALAYCSWAREKLPTEAQWELAAQGAEREEANVWQGVFPYDARGLATTSPVGSYAPNPLGVVDAVGNVWEWTRDPWTHDHAPRCCGPVHDPLAPGVMLHVAKGGSFLCSEDYCARYRPAARLAMAVDSAACHLGFRTVVAGVLLDQMHEHPHSARQALAERAPALGGAGEQDTARVVDLAEVRAAAGDDADGLHLANRQLGHAVMHQEGVGRDVTGGGQGTAGTAPVVAIPFPR